MLAAKLDHNVAAQHAGLGRRRLGLHFSNQNATFAASPQRLPQVGGQRLNADPQVTPHHPAFFEQAFHDGLHHVGRNGKADTLTATRRRGDRSVDADQLAAQIHQRATRIARVNRRVGLDEVFEISDVHIGAALGAHNTHRHRLREAKRTANRQHDLAQTHLVRISERNCL